MLVNVLSALRLGYVKIMNVVPSTRVLLLGGSGVEETTESAGVIDVEGLLNRSGAESGDGALSGVYDFVVDIGAGGLTIGQTAFVYIAVVGFLATGIGFIVHGNNVAKNADNKSAFGWRFIGAVLGFAAGTLVIFAQTVGTSLFR